MPSVRSFPKQTSPNFETSLEPSNSNVSDRDSIKFRNRIARTKVYFRKRREEKQLFRKAKINLAADGRPIVNVWLEDTLVEGLLDSGANVSVLGKGYVLLRKLKLGHKRINCEVQIAGGDSQCVKGFVNLET